jgi:hypothetical protein
MKTKKAIQMESHTLILATPKAEIPSKDIIPFVKKIIESNIANIDYFGGALDNGMDFFDDEMKLKFDGTTYITLHFEDNEIYYTGIGEDKIFEMILTKIANDKIGEVIIDEKDIEIYIY